MYFGNEGVLDADSRERQEGMKTDSLPFMAILILF